MSVKSTVASTRSAPAPRRTPVRNSSISSRIASDRRPTAVVVARQLDQPRARDVLGHETGALDGNDAVAGPVHDQRRHADRRQDVAHVDLRVHLRQGDAAPGLALSRR